MKRAVAQGSDLILVGIALCVTLIFTGTCIFADSYDNDVWFFLATGQYIVEHGIPYTNPFSIQPDMGFVAQQWLHCVISYGIFSLGGFVGLGLWTSVLFLALALSLFLLGKKLRQERGGGEVVMILVALCVMAASAYASVRPHLYSMLIFVWIVWFMESYRATSEKRWLIAIPLIVCLHVNLHAAIAPYDLFIIACYLIPDGVAWAHKKGKLTGVALAQATYPRLPLLVALIVSALALFANPYGAQGAFYLVLSLGAASYRDRINEMGSFVPADSWEGMLNVALMFAAVFAAGRMGPKRINLPLAILCVAGIVVTLLYLRNQWLNALFCFAFLVWATKGVSLTAASPGRSAQAVCIGLVLVGVIGMASQMALAAPKLAELPTDSSKTPVAAMDELDEMGVDREQTKVFTFFNAGGYIEYRGYKVNMDPRPEIWNASINGTGMDYYKEYADMASGNLPFATFNDRYDFDVFIIDANAGTDPYFIDNPDYVKLLAGNGYTAYAKRSWADQYE